MLINPPNDQLSELSVLSCMMQRKNDLENGVELLNESDFFFPENGLIFSHISRLLNDNKDVNINTVRASLQFANELDKIGGMQKLMMIEEHLVGRVKEPAQSVLELSKQRQLIQLGRLLISETTGNSSQDTIKRAQNELDKIFDSSLIDKPQSIIDVLNAAREEAIRIKQERLAGNLVGCCVWGLAELDEILPINPKRMYTVGALSGMGKTTFALNVLLKNAKLGITGAMFSIEMDSLSIGMNMLCNTLKLENTRVQSGYIDAGELEMIANKDFGDMPGIVREYSTIDIESLAIDVRRLKREYGINFIIADYLQRIEAKDESVLRQTVIKVTNGLARIAKDNDIAVISLAQPNRRAANDDKDHRPRMSDFAESSQIEKESWAVVVLHREHVFDSASDPNMMEILIRKNRSGRMGFVEAYCDMSRYIIADRRV